MRGNRQLRKRYWLGLIGAFAVLLVLAFAGAPNSPKAATGRNPEITLAAALGPNLCAWPPARVRQAADVPAESYGGELPPVRYVFDPYPTFNGIAVDPSNNLVVMSDENRKSVLIYQRTAGSESPQTTRPLRQIIGPKTEIGYTAGVALDSGRHELYAVNNDTEDRLVVFGYDATGDMSPKRQLYLPHQAWGVSLDPAADQIAVSVQQLSMIAIYRREASGLEAPLRIIRGPHTGMADPHGVQWDWADHEIVVANHGNHSDITPYSAYTEGNTSPAAGRAGGHFFPPSIEVFEDSAKGDARPVRVVEGPRTRLNWPMGVDVDKVHNEIAVANNGDNSVLIFARTASGDAAPLRVIHGPRSGISSPMGVAIDAKNNEIWVANYGDHTALVFPRTASGDAVPERIVRNAPEGTPTGGFGNPYAVAYDSKRDELLVPN